MFVTINGGERPRAAAFGSDPRPFLESSNGLRPLPSDSFNEGACSRPTRKKRSRLPALGLVYDPDVFRSTSWSVDGTFFVCPAMYYQVGSLLLDLVFASQIVCDLK